MLFSVLLLLTNKGVDDLRPHPLFMNLLCAISTEEKDKRELQWMKKTKKYVGLQRAAKSSP